MILRLMFIFLRRKDGDVKRKAALHDLNIHMVHIKLCDNKSNCHNPITVGEDTNALRVYCIQCHATIVIRKTPWGSPEKNHYAKVFRRDILQGGDPLFYKIYPHWLKT